MKKDKVFATVIASMIFTVVMSACFFLYDYKLAAKNKNDNNTNISGTNGTDSNQDVIVITQPGYNMLTKEEAKRQGLDVIFVRGTILCTKTGGYMLITDPEYTEGYPTQTPILLQPQKNNSITVFKEGDVVEIMCGPIAESWPMQTTVMGYKVISHGDLSGLDEEVLKQLIDYGWII